MKYVNQLFDKYGNKLLTTYESKSKTISTKNETNTFR